MSSILNRLKAVEGATFQREAATDTPHSAEPSPSDCGLPIADCGLEASRTRPTRTTGAHGARSVTTVWLYRLLPGVVVLLLILLLWRPWGSQPPVSKPLSQGLRPDLAVSRGESRAEVPGVVRPSALAQAASSGFSSLPVADFGRQDAGQSDKSDGSQTSPSLPGDTGKAHPEALTDKQPAASAVPVEDSIAARVLAPDDAPVKAFLRSLKITGVYQDAGGYIAFINGRALKEGDDLERVQIAEIRSERITFAHHGKRYVLPLH